MLLLLRWVWCGCDLAGEKENEEKGLRSVINIATIRKRPNTQISKYRHLRDLGREKQKNANKIEGLVFFCFSTWELIKPLRVVSSFCFVAKTSFYWFLMAFFRMNGKELDSVTCWPDLRQVSFAVCLTDIFLAGMFVKLFYCCLLNVRVSVI